MANYGDAGFWTQQGDFVWCAEQCFMIEKAKRFDEPATVQRLLAIARHEDAAICNGRTAQMKDLGRNAIPQFDDEVWSSERFSAMLRCLLAKFSQHEDLAWKLLATGDRYIAESAKYDREWGIGFSAVDGPLGKGAMRKSEGGSLVWSVGPDSWPADGNLLGKALMWTRGCLRLQASLEMLVLSPV